MRGSGRATGSAVIVAVVLAVAVAFVLWGGFIHGLADRGGYRRGYDEGVRRGRRG
jgi:hypothetical protein